MKNRYNDTSMRRAEKQECSEEGDGCDQHSDSDSSPRESVLFIGPYPPPFSGPELGMKLFLESSLQETLDIHFLQTNTGGSLASKGRIDLRSIVGLAAFFLRLVTMIARHRPRVAYYPITATEIGWLGRDVPCILLCKLLGLRVIIHLRAGHLSLNFQRFRPFVQRLARFACRRVDLALVQAKCLKREFAGLVPDERIDVLYQAIETENFGRDGNEPDPNAVLFLGMLSQAKGYADLVEAIPLVARKFQGVVFHVCGEIIRDERNVHFDQTTGRRLPRVDAEAVHEAINSSAYVRNYRYHGVVAGEEKMDLMRRAAIFVLPSYSEGFSRAILEAMAMGLPLVYTPVGANAEVLANGVNGFEVLPGDANAIADGIERLLADANLRDRIGATNAAYARRAFDIEEVAVRLGGFIERLASS